MSVLEKFKTINVFVYSGGKTGSSTMHNTMIKHGFHSIHVHGNIHFQVYISKSKTTALEELINSAIKKHEKVYIITIYRNPIERYISSFFHNIKLHVPGITDKVSTESLLKMFNDKGMYNLESNHPLQDVLTQFNLTLPPTFDFEKEYVLVQDKNLTVLCLRFGSIDKWSAILSEVFQKPIQLLNDNLSDSKWYYKMYKNFQKAYRPSKEHFDSVTNHALFKYFNTSEEQETYKQKWMSEPIESQPLSAGLASYTQNS